MIETRERDGQWYASLSGDWTLANLPTQVDELEDRLRALVAKEALWDLRAITRLDSVGAFLLWRAWGRHWPASLELLRQHRSVLERAEATPTDQAVSRVTPHLFGVLVLGRLTLAVLKN